MTKLKLILLIFLFLQPDALFAQVTNQAILQLQVESAERSFAGSMADRDHEAFNSFLSEEAVFFTGETALRGKQQVSDAWKSYFDTPEAPFSWEPGQVEVLDSGTLALSSGPVYNPAGERVATFTSIWRQESHGQWRIIFDKGNKACED